MADADITITPGTGIKVDTRTVGAGTDEHRQVVNIGSPVTAANVAEVDTLGVQASIAGRAFTTVTGTITTATSTIAAAAVGAGNATITINGTYAGVSYVFEASDDSGTNYFPVQVVQEDTGQVLINDTPGTNAKVGYLVDLPGWTNIRVRATAWTSGTANVRITPGGMPFVPVVSIGDNKAATPTITTVSTSTTSAQVLAAILKGD